MFVSVMSRRTAITDGAQWRERLHRGLARIRGPLEKYPGFQGVDYFWGAANDGQMLEVSRWSSRTEFEACLEGGGYATAATFLDAMLPTAPYPNGNWVRQDWEQVA